MTIVQELLDIDLYHAMNDDDMAKSLTWENR